MSIRISNCYDNIYIHITIGVLCDLQVLCIRQAVQSLQKSSQRDSDGLISNYYEAVSGRQSSG